MAATEAFTGFSRQGIQFLVELGLNNDRAWFVPRKAEYERLLKEPLEALCLALGERFERARLPLRSDPSRSPFRIYRDVRFSADKSPYKTHISASFPWIGKGGGVGAYFHLRPGDVFAGGGMWHPAPEQLAAWRRAVDGDLARVRAALDDPEFRSTFGEIGGDKLKRVPTGFAPDHPAAELLKHKDVTFEHRLTDAEVMAPNLPDTLVEVFRTSIPVLELLASLSGNDTSATWLRGNR